MDRSAGSPRVTAALEALRASGERVTPARQAVLRVIDAADGSDEHLSAEQISERVTRLEPSVHRATVYRTLTALTDAGVLSHVHLGGSATVYHLVAHPRERAREASPAAYGLGDGHPHAHGHLHVQCSICGRVQDAPPDVLDEAGRQLREALGFDLDTTHAALLGRCSDCAGAAGR
ncbi:transcriptional repressor [Intrasporangium sp. DVR]|uniref:Fur family transcriptional regulator n=1 Tax=Intrasporangium sp. DVR TaxID=3127867 RepID=UPI00313A727E